MTEKWWSRVEKNVKRGIQEEKSGIECVSVNGYW